MKNGRTVRLVAAATRLTLYIARNHLILNAAHIMRIGMMSAVVMRSAVVRINMNIDRDRMNNIAMTAIQTMGMTGRSGRYAETREGQRQTSCQDSARPKHPVFLPRNSFIRVKDRADAS